MKKRIVVEYDVVADKVAILENDLTVTESLGVLELAKSCLASFYMEQQDAVHIALYYPDESDGLEKQEDEDSE